MDNVTFRKRKGKVIGSLKVEKKGRYVATPAQARISMRMANLVALWREFEGNLHPSFGLHKGLATDYNSWIKYNMKHHPVYLTKDEFEQGGAVISSYKVSCGKLRRITATANSSGIVKTDISLGSAFAISASTTVKAFSEAVINSNTQLKFKDGDKITAYKAVQSVDSDGIPHVSISSQQVQLDVNDSTTLLLSVVDSDCFSVVDGCLGTGAAITGGVVWVHSRRSGSETLVSTQSFVVVNTVLAAYQTTARMQTAARSYGTLREDDFLTPDNDDTAAEQTVNP